MDFETKKFIINYMQKRAVVIYGPPGSGKGTQAELLAKKYYFIHFDTGRYFENIFRSRAAKKDPVFRREKKLFDSGILFTPAWVLKTVSQATKEIAKAGFSIVYSGSPRTLFEAFGLKNNGLIKLLGELYGRKNITVIKLNIREKTTISRNSQRLVCVICGLPILANSKSKRCSFCAGPMRKRTLDDPKVIKVRLKEYRERTYPILQTLKKFGFEINEINGEPLPYKVFAQIIKALKIG